MQVNPLATARKECPLSLLANIFLVTSYSNKNDLNVKGNLKSLYFNSKMLNDPHSLSGLSSWSIPSPSVPTTLFLLDCYPVLRFFSLPVLPVQDCSSVTHRTWLSSSSSEETPHSTPSPAHHSKGCSFTCYDAGMLHIFGLLFALLRLWVSLVPRESTAYWTAHCVLTQWIFAEQKDQWD